MVQVSPFHFIYYLEVSWIIFWDIWLEIWSISSFFKVISPYYQKSETRYMLQLVSTHWTYICEHIFVNDRISELMCLEAFWKTAPFCTNETNAT